jgi:hypothetical protein
MKKEAYQSADSAVRRIDWLLSRRYLQRSTRRRLKELRNDIVRLRNCRNRSPDDVALLALQWAATLASIFQLIATLLK